MKSAIRLELIRAFKNKLFLFALAVGLILAIANVILIALPASFSEAMWDVSPSFKTQQPPSFFSHWIGLTPFTITTSIFYYILPLLACIPYGASLCSDITSRFSSQLVTRVGRLRYFTAKALSAVLVAGTTLVVPLFVNIVFVACLLPQIMPGPSTHLYAVMANSMLADFFYERPWAYIWVFLALTFFGAGLFGLLSTTLSFFIHNPFIVTLAPFLFCLALQFATQGTILEGFTPLNSLQPSQPYPAVFWIVISLMVLTFVLLAVVIARKGACYEELVEHD